MPQEHQPVTAKSTQTICSLGHVHLAHMMTPHFRQKLRRCSGSKAPASLSSWPSDGPKLLTDFWNYVFRTLKMSFEFLYEWAHFRGCRLQRWLCFLPRPSEPEMLSSCTEESNRARSELGSIWRGLSSPVCRSCRLKFEYWLKASGVSHIPVGKQQNLLFFFNNTAIFTCSAGEQSGTTMWCPCCDG